MQECILITKQFVYELHHRDASGHDWYHIERVWNNAKKIARQYKNVNQLVIELSALLHDVADVKLHNNKEEANRLLVNFVESLSISTDEKNAILEVIRTVSYNGGNNEQPTTLEGKIVQDADRLDAIGAIGIARSFAYGGKKGQAMYDPQIQVRNIITEQDYRNGPSTSINHFYEKLLLLKDLLHTDEAKKIAESRQIIMEQFLHQFFEEWNGNR